MSQLATPDHAQICKRLRTVFGKPDDSMGCANRWRLHTSDPYALPSNIHVDDNVDVPSIWIFDPHQPHRNIEQIMIESDDGLRRAIATIHEHLWRANRPARHGLPPLPAPSRRYLAKLLADCRQAAWPEAPCLMAQVKEAMLLARRSSKAVANDA